MEAYASLLSPAELAAVRSGDDVAEDVRTERLLSRALARVTLARYTRTSPAVRPAFCLRYACHAVHCVLTESPFP